jgi:hypothetical protein
MDFPKVLMAFQETKQGDFKIAEQIVKDQTEADHFLTKYTKSTVRIEARRLTITERNQISNIQTSIPDVQSKKSSFWDRIFGIISIYKQAVKNVPLLKYSWILIATICILTLAGFFKLKSAEVFLYALYVIGVSFLGFLFSYLLKTKDKFIRGLLYVLLGCIVLLISAIILSFLTYVLFEQPKFYDRWFSTQTSSKKDSMENQPKSAIAARTSYIDLELYQNAINKTVGGTTEFDADGPHGGRTIGDLKIALEYTDGLLTKVSYQMWQPGPGAFAYYTLMPPKDKVQPPTDKIKALAPNGAFGWTFYGPLQYVLSVTDFVSLIGGISRPGESSSLPYKTLLIRSRSSVPDNYDLKDLIPLKQLDDDEIKFTIFSETLFESHQSEQTLKESIVIVHNFEITRLRDLLKSANINRKEDKLATSIIEIRDNINNIFYYKHKEKLLLLDEERNLADFFENANSKEEFSHRVASLAQVSQRLNVDILRSLTKETDKEIKSIQLLDKFLIGMGKQNKEITEALRNLSRVRQGYPTHTDMSGSIAALDYFGISYPVKDYESAWQILLKSYY